MRIFALTLGVAAFSVVGSTIADPAQPAAAPAWHANDPGIHERLAALKAATQKMIAASDKQWNRAAGLDQPPQIWRVAGAIEELWDASFAPRMKIIPAGEYTMGWSESNPMLFVATPVPPRGSMTRHRVRIDYPFALSRHPVSVDEFAAFVADTGYDAGNACQIDMSPAKSGYNWRNPGFQQEGSSPVVCVNSPDAQAYVTWLARKTSRDYRLPSEAEYEYAQRAGSTTAYWWGDAVDGTYAACAGCGSVWDDKRTPPLGALPANAFGLYEIAGSIWSRTGDCWSATYEKAPSDGSVNRTGDCNQAVLRGGAFRTRAAHLRSPVRHPTSLGARYNDDGFHVVRVF